MGELDGVWTLRRSGGLLPPLAGVRKRIAGEVGHTTFAGARLQFDVVGRELRYRPPLRGLVDVLEPAGAGWRGRTLLGGRELGAFSMERTKGDGMTPLEEQLVKHIDEAIALEESVKRMLDGMLATTADPGVVDLLEHHKEQTEEHARRLRERLQAHGASPSLVREAGGILGALAKLPLDLVRGEKAGRNARDAYATEHLEIAAYQLLERVAERAGDTETADVARRNRADEEAMARKLDEHWDLFATEALREEGVTV